MTTAIGAYQYYRLLFQTAGTYYTCINLIKAYESADGSGTELLSGSTPTVSSNYNAASTAAHLIDGLTTTRWESTKNGAGVNWCAFAFPSAVTLRSFVITSIDYAGEVPMDFDIQVSNDGVTWQTLRSVRGFSGAVTYTNKLCTFNYVVGGVSTIDTGQRSVRVLVFDWDSAAFLQSVTPNDDGTWEWRPSNLNDLLITHVGPSGYRPISDGPVTPYAE